MPVDANIALGVKPVELPNPLAIAGQAATLRDLAMRNQVQQQQLQAGQVSLEQNQRALQDQKTIADLYKANMAPDGSVDHAGVISGLAQAGLGDKIPAYQQQVAAVDEAQAKATGQKVTTAGADLKNQADKAQFISDLVGRLASNPTITHDQVIAELAKAPPQFAQDAAAAARNLPADPAQLHQFLLTAGLSAQERLKALTPQLQQMELGGTTNLIDQNPLTRGAAPTTFNRTITPDQQAKVDLQREKGVFTSDQSDLLAALAAKGISLPAGMRSKEQQISTLKGLIEKYPDLAPDEIADKIGAGQINFGSDKKAATVAAGQEGKVSTAVNELSTFGDQALAASAKVPRGNFIPANQLMQMADSSISDPNLLTLKLKLNALNNAYNVLSARGGTDAESRHHVQQLFSAANGPEGVAALVQGLKEEGAGAQSSAAKASHVGTTPAPGTRPPLSAFGPKP